MWKKTFKESNHFKLWQSLRYSEGHISPMLSCRQFYTFKQALDIQTSPGHSLKHRPLQWIFFSLFKIFSAYKIIRQSVSYLNSINKLTLAGINFLTITNKPGYPVIQHFSVHLGVNREWALWFFWLCWLPRNAEPHKFLPSTSPLHEISWGVFDEIC